MPLMETSDAAARDWVKARKAEARGIMEDATYRVERAVAARYEATERWLMFPVDEDIDMMPVEILRSFIHKLEKLR